MTRGLQIPPRPGRQARDLRDREHGGLLRSVRLSSTCAWRAATPRSWSSSRPTAWPTSSCAAPATRCCTTIARRCINIIQELGSEPGIRRIRIFNQEGRITSPPIPRETATATRRAAPRRRPRSASSAIRQGQRVLAVIRPIENSPDCSNAACHVHPARQQVLGVIDANLSLATVDAQMAQHQAALRWFLVGAIVFGCLRGGRVHVGRGVPAGEGADRRHPPRGRWRSRLPAAGPLRRRTGRPGRVVQQDDGRSGRRAGAHRRAGPAQDGRAGARSQDAAQLGKDGLHRQTRRHRRARDQQSAVRHPDLRAAGAAGTAEARRSRAATKWRSSSRPSSGRASAAATW